MKYIILFLLLIPTLAFCQQKKTSTTASRDSIINRWLKAVINIEGRPYFSERAISDLVAKWRRHEVDSISFQRQYDSLNYIKNAKYSGTAVFLKHDNHHFLLTARHVLADNFSKDTNRIFQRIILIENDTLLNKYNDTYIDERGNRLLSNDAENIVLMNMGSGPYKNRPYVFSSIANDLGIINLDAADMSFTRTLLNRGYVPISISDIDTLFKPKVGQEIFAIGFPVESQRFHKLLPPQLNAWESTQITVPVISFGKISNTLKNSSYFEGSIFFYHGNSGGPIISNNKLIGIVSGFDLETVLSRNSAPFHRHYLYHSRFIKSSLIPPLLKELKSKKIM